MDPQTAEYERIASGFDAPSLKPPVHYGDMTKVVFVHFIKFMKSCKSQKQLQLVSEACLNTPGFYDCLRDLFTCVELGFIPYDIERSKFRSTIRNCITNDKSAKNWLIQSGLWFVNDILDKVVPRDKPYPVTAVNPIVDQHLPKWCRTQPDVHVFSDESSYSDDNDSMVDLDAESIHSVESDYSHPNTSSQINPSGKQKIQMCPHCPYVTAGGHLKRHIQAKH